MKKIKNDPKTGNVEKVTPSVKSRTESQQEDMDTSRSSDPPPTLQVEELVTESNIKKPDKALEVQDNTFIGKIKRLSRLMKSKKRDNKSQGFFGRLKSSVQEVFGKQEDEYYEEYNSEEPNTQTTSSFDETLKEGVDPNKFNVSVFQLENDTNQNKNNASKDYRGIIK